MVRNTEGRKLEVSRSKIRTTAAVTGCVIALGGFATAAPASAAPSAPHGARAGVVQAAIAPSFTGRSDYCDSYVCGSGTFTDSNSKRNLTGAMSVRFPCNKGVTSARIRLVTNAPTGKRYGAWHTTQSCGQYALFGNLAWTQSEPIYAWAIEENRSGGGLATGSWVFL
ncbi:MULTISPECIES: hypothetical protein [unclassified Streptomyces]|uniref:hypothetical protein n=1 Tax=unclassified Streptomyces TaxID=2593676 RepID=UPI00382582B1